MPRTFERLQPSHTGSSSTPSSTPRSFGGRQLFPPPKVRLDPRTVLLRHRRAGQDR